MKYFIAKVIGTIIYTSVVYIIQKISGTDVALISVTGSLFYLILGKEDKS